MAEQKLHPTVMEFKEFVKKHPKLVQEVRTGKRTWQELYEDWYLLGEDDSSWNAFRNKNDKKKDDAKSSDFMSKILSSVKNLNVNDFQNQISNVGSTISTIQSVINQFQSFKQPNQSNETTRPNHPFAFRKD